MLLFLYFVLLLFWVSCEYIILLMNAVPFSTHFSLSLVKSRGRGFTRLEKEEIVETYIFSRTTEAAQIVIAHATARVFPWRAWTSVVVAASIRTTIRSTRSSRATPTARSRVAWNTNNYKNYNSHNQDLKLPYLVHHPEHLLGHPVLVVHR